jgi:conjugal transfer pilus assembly protein TraF
MAIFLCCLYLIGVMPAGAFASGFFNEHQEGWFWYQDPTEIQKRKVHPNPALLLSPTEEMRALQKKVEDSINLAILYPTEENLINYARNYHEVTRRGQQFTDAYKWMLLNNPEWDYSLKFPVNPLSQNVYLKQREQTIEQAVRQFALTHGFFFFFKGTCGHCHVFAPTVKQLCDKYGISIVAVSVDGGILPEFPQAVQDYHASVRFNVHALPALFAVNPKTQQVIPIANTAISLYEIEENIFRFMQFEQTQRGRI